MKRIATFVMVISMLINPTITVGQQKCKVLLPNISGSYTGKCKKGLAHGKGIAKGIDTYEGRFQKGLPNGMGTYIWASGDSYIGDWEFGKREGKGIYKFNLDGKDSIQAGVWKNDIYMGSIPPPPTVMQSRNIQQYSFQRYGDNNKLNIEIYMNGSINSTIDNLSIISSNASYRNIGKTIVFDNVMYPSTFKMTYRTWNKMHTAQLEAVFEFTITEPGNWLLRLTN